MKKALCLFLAAALTLTLWACGAPETAIQKLESPPAAQDAEAAPAAELPDEPPAEASAQPPEPPEEAAAPVQEAEPESAAEEALPEEPPAEPAAPEEIAEEAAEPAADTAGESASDHAGHSQSGAGVTVPAPEQGENLVWIPTNGGTKYHTSAKCCNMKNPIQVTLETALANGFTPCKRCH